MPYRFTPLHEPQGPDGLQAGGGPCVPADCVEECGAPRGDIAEALKSLHIVLTVTSGRSGTGLLAKLMGLHEDTTSTHEPEPRLNHQLRRTIEDPVGVFRYLAEVKLPAIAATTTRRYVETSHLYCKGFIEPLLLMGLRPTFCVLHRPPWEVALSLYRMNVIPGRTYDGVLVLLKPNDPGVLPLIGWESLSDYALCYWYAMEIERRQRKYSDLFGRMGIAFVTCRSTDLLDFAKFLEISRGLGLVSGGDDAHLRARYDAIVAVNQNPREKAMPGAMGRRAESGLDQDEALVDRAISLYEPDLVEEVRRRYRI